MLFHEEDPVGRWVECMREHGFRVTEPRRAVAVVLAHSDVALPPDRILDHARELHPALGLVTVYRTVEILGDLGLVRRVHRDGGCHAYLRASPGHHHALVCRGCGRAVEFAGNDDLDRLHRRIERDTGYQIDGHLLQLSGVCPDCRDRAKPRRPDR